MLLTLLLDFGAAGDNGLAVLAWALALACWVPQLLAAWVVLRPASHPPRGLRTQVLLLLAPVLLLGVVAAGVPVLAVLLFAYSAVAWGWWLLVLVLPTAGALLGLVARYGTASATEAGPVAAPARRVRRLALGGLLLALGVGAARSYRPLARTWSGERSREERAAKVRADSLRFVERFP